MRLSAHASSHSSSSSAGSTAAPVDNQWTVMQNTYFFRLGRSHISAQLPTTRSVSVVDDLKVHEPVCEKVESGEALQT